jgi:hypothetical protein
MKGLISDKSEHQYVRGIERRLESTYATFDTIKSIKMELSLYAK